MVKVVVLRNELHNTVYFYSNHEIRGVIFGRGRKLKVLLNSSSHGRSVNRGEGFKKRGKNTIWSLFAYASFLYDFSEDQGCRTNMYMYVHPVSKNKQAKNIL